MDHKRVLILYADAGFGHRSAALAIQSAMQERYGSFCTIDMVNALEDERTPAVLRDSQSDYDKIIKNIPELYKIGYEASDGSLTRTLMESALTLMLFDVMRDLVKRYEPNVIVSTYPLYLAPLDALFTIEGSGIPMVVSITDLVAVHRIWFNVGVDTSLVPTADVKKLAIQDGLSEHQIVETGIPVSTQFVREQRTKSQLQTEFGLDPNRYTFLVAGSKRVDGLPEILSGLNHSGLPAQLLLVAGGDDDLYERFKSEDWHIPVKLFNYVDFMPALMRVSDVNICKAGGLTVSESLACGLPMILVNVLPGQETGNADYVLQNQAGVIARDPLALLETAAHWLENNGELLHATSQAAARIGHPQAAYQAADLIWQAANCEPSARNVTHLFERAKLTRNLKRYRKELREWASDRG